MVDQQTELAADTLKARVRDHCEQQTCATRYGKAAELVNKAAFFSTSNSLCLSFILLAALAVRVYICFYSGLGIYNTDTITYFQMADGILTGAPISYFPNGFPLNVAFIKYIVGDTNVDFTLLVENIILSTSVVWMTFFIGRRILNPTSALIATTIVAFWPNQLNYVRQLMSEVPAEFFLISSIYMLLYGKGFLSGLSFWVAGLIRSSLSSIAIISFFVVALSNKNKTGVLFLLGGLAAGLAVGIVIDYSLQLAGVIKPPSNFGSNLLIAIGSYSSDTNFSVSSTDYEKAHPITTYLAFAFHQPKEFLIQRISAAWELWGLWPSSGNPEAPRGLATKVLIGLRFPVLLLAMYAAWKRRNNMDAVIIALPIIEITAVHTVFFASPRFTYPAEPLLIVLAVGGCGEFYNFVTKSARRFGV